MLRAPETLAATTLAAKSYETAAHYSAGAYGSTPLMISLAGSSLVLSWSAGTLQQATSVSGPYIDVSGVTGTSLTVPVSNASLKFYRLRY